MRALQHDEKHALKSEDSLVMTTPLSLSVLEHPGFPQIMSNGNKALVTHYNIDSDWWRSVSFNNTLGMSQGFQCFNGAGLSVTTVIIHMICYK